MDDRFDERLHERLSALDAAVPPEAPVGRSRLAAPIRPRVVRAASMPSMGLAAALVLALVALISAGLAAQQFVATGPTSSPTAAASASTEATASVPATSPSGSAVIIGTEGFPVSIDGQPVYRLDDRGTWQSLSGSFLVAAGAPYGATSCPAASPLPTAEADLLGQCPEVILFQTSGFTSGDERGMGTAPKSLSLQAVAGWGGRIIVVRAHTHDPEAAQCGAAVRAGCEAALVVEAVVWPSVPHQIGGELVYRGRDVLSGVIGPGSFLFGGLVRLDANGPVSKLCTTDKATPQLLPYCTTGSATIDGVEVAPPSVVQAMDGRVVVVRVHVAGSLGAECPAVVTECAHAIILESVVWSSNPYPPATPTLMATPSGTPSTGPSPAVDSQTPSPADAAAAKSLVDRYTAALVRGDYATAYRMLAPETQGQWQSLADFIYERSAYFKSVAGRYVIQVWPTDVGPITQWLTDSNRAFIDLHHAVLVEVDYPALVMNGGVGNAGVEIFIVSPGANGLEIFAVR